jgi:hypothetical protein
MNLFEALTSLQFIANLLYCGRQASKIRRERLNGLVIQYNVCANDTSNLLQEKIAGIPILAPRELFAAP